MSRLHQLYNRLGVVAGLALIPAVNAYASGTGMPWEDPLQQVLDSITGPVAETFGVLAIVVAGLGFAFNDGGTFVRRGFGALFGLSIAFAATVFFLPLFGFAGGATF